MNRTNYKFSLAIDLGAKKTGVFMLSHKAGEQATSKNCKAATLVMPEEEGGLKYSTKKRTAVRHRIRGKKRFALARRLLMLITSQVLSAKGINLSDTKYKKMTESLSGLLKRRGYSRIESETDLTILESLDSSVFAQHEVLGKYFNEGLSLAEQWENLSQDTSRVSNFNSDTDIPSPKAFKDFLKADYSEYANLHENYLDGLKTLKTDANNLVMQQSMGHRHRKKYLEEILADMRLDSRLTEVAKAFGGIERLWRLVGNISNLQLRAERWYFNAPEMVQEDRWEPKRLQKTLVRAFKYFHPPKEQSRQFKELIDELANAKDIIEALCTIDPVRTIPPYEDQNNRRPPVDHTLLLSPTALNKRFGEKWLSWANYFLNADPVLEVGLDEILAYPDRRSRITPLGGKPLDTRYYFSSYILQRVLDRVRAKDIFSLRAISNGAKGNQAISATENLKRVLGSQHVEEFLSFAADYYTETADAKSGLWLGGEKSLLERSDIHPPMKNKILDTLVANLFGKDNTFGQRFIENHWNNKVTGRSTVRSMCMAIETTRKNFGGEFNIAYKNALRNKERGAKPTNEEKELLRVETRIKDLTKFFEESLGLSPSEIQRIANPFSLAQLYTLIETERTGFTSTTLAVHKENAWRMSHGEDDTPQCSRLPADAIRPFDGVLRKVLDRQAWELTKLASEEICRTVTDKNSIVDIAIIAEQNKFAFTASVAEIKKNLTKKAKTNLEQQRDRQEKRWKEKDIRIKEASCGICPYTGEKLNADGLGEIDHIIPRSRTTAAMGTIFNSEANLIFVSPKGNQTKGNQSYYLENLSDKYLEKRFQTKDIRQIEQRIEECVQTLANTGKIKYFDLLSDDEQACVRHALFLRENSPARRIAEQELATSSKTWVNGTQAWLIRAFVQKMQKELATWCNKTGNTLNFRSWSTDVMVSSRIRSTLGEYDKTFTKIQPQPVASHSIDAMCAYATACGIEQINMYMGGNEKLSDARFVKELYELYPNSCDVIRIKALDLSDKKDFASQAIFKEGILAEHFVPIMLHKGVVRLGFKLPAKNAKTSSSIEVTGRDPMRLIRILMPYLDREVNFESEKLETYHIDKQKAFTLLAEINLRKATDEELIAASVLESLHYVTERKSIISQITDKGKFKAKNDILKSNFDINIKSPKNLNFKIDGKIELPSKNEWMALCDHEMIAPLLGEKVTDENNLRKMLDNRYRTNSSKRKHVPVRRDPSLPVLATSSGLFRIRRQTPDKQPVYQACNISGSKYAGFSANNDKVDWNTPITYKSLSSKNVTGFGERYTEYNQLITMQNWRNVEKGKVKIDMAPGTEGRRYIRITVPFSEFKKWYEISTETPLLNALQLQDALKVDAKKFKSAVGNKLSELVGQPRSNLFIEKLGKEEVIFQYIVDSSNAHMKNAYNK